MMDSQENALLQGTMEEPAKKAYATKQEVLERVKEIARSAEAPNKEELDHLKTTFYKLHLAERDAQTKEYLEKVVILKNSYSYLMTQKKLSRLKCRSSRKNAPRSSSNRKRKSRKI